MTKTNKTPRPGHPANTPATIEELTARIAALEADNKKLRAAPAPVPAPQAVDAVSKNRTEPLVQKTRSGTVILTLDDGTTAKLPATK